VIIRTLCVLGINSSVRGVRNTFALQIAADIRPPDRCYDGSGDGSVTSLDALMILQAAAGGGIFIITPAHRVKYQPG
ncbi:MAG: hypothetical protein KAR25_08045, partial [Methanosarcinales archaeon]|nr:hypothetical protein [Methanosarcinales archaeon]